MSPDSAKENALVGESSVNEWKQDIGNSDDPESSSYKANEESDPTKADKVGRSHCRTGIPTVTQMEKLYNTKYFIIKSLNHQNFRLSVEKGIWATQVKNEPILEEAFHNSGRVILIFSINMSGSFQGYAQMMSSIGRRGRNNVWIDGSGRSNSWGHNFKVKWLRLYDLPFHKTIHLKNPLNDYKPVKISRDCQELTPEIGLALCELLDDKTDLDDPVSSSSRDTFSFKGQSAEIPSSNGDETCNLLPQNRSCSMPLPYPSVPYHIHAEVNRFSSANHGFSSSSNFTGMLPSKHSHFSGNIPKLQVERNMASQFGVWGLPAESLLASTLTEDDFLDMSYEEYLEFHDRCRKQLCSGATKPYQTQSGPSRSNSHDDDRNIYKPVRDRSRRIHHQ